MASKVEPISVSSNFEPVAFSICWSPADLMGSYERIEQLAESEDHVIPGHDPLVRELYPTASDDGEVVRLDELPARALRTIYPDAPAT